MLIIPLDTKPQEPEAACQYSAFLYYFMPFWLNFKNFEFAATVRQMTAKLIKEQFALWKGAQHFATLKH